MDTPVTKEEGKRKIEDAGEVLPYARKHLAEDTGPQVSRAVRKADVFPEPDWSAMVAAGRDPACVARLAMIYESVPNGPRPDGYRWIDGDVWTKGYIQALRYLRHFIHHADTLDAARGYAKWLASQFGGTPDSIARASVSEYVAYWAASRGGSRTLYAPGSLTTRQSWLANAMYRMGWPQRRDMLLTNVIPMRFTDGRWCVVRIEGEGVVRLGEWSHDEQQALEEAMRMSAELAQASQGLEVRSRPATAERKGPPVLANRDVDPEALLKDFRIRGIQFGEYVPQAERRAAVANLYEALADLADVLGMPRRWMGLGGMGVAIGARGKSSALAHFEPRLNVINFTRRRGAGSLAHEWWHALDARIVVGSRGFTSLLEQCQAEQRWPRESMTKASGPTGQALVQCHYIVQALQKSDLMRQAQRIEEVPRAKKYWTNIEELGARTFESWVEDTLVARGLSSPYLVHGTLEADNGKNPERSPYPRGEERKQLGAMMAKLIEILRTGGKG